MILAELSRLADLPTPISQPQLEKTLSLAIGQHADLGEPVEPTQLVVFLVS